MPSGILLWGPPGTGKTLMAEAVAGETGKPYMFVDPSAFVQTFIGVAPMKIKWLYRKLRKQALRNGGVVVFFDEADVLGNRGSTSQGGQFDSRREHESLAGLHSCNAVHYVDDHDRSRIVWHGLQPVDSRHRRGGPEAPQIAASSSWAAWAWAAASGALQALLTEMSGLKQAARLLQPPLPVVPVHEAEGAAEVPDPAHHGHQPAGHARRTPCCGPGASTASTRSATRTSTAAAARSRATSTRSATS